MVWSVVEAGAQIGARTYHQPGKRHEGASVGEAMSKKRWNCASRSRTAFRWRNRNDWFVVVAGARMARAGSAHGESDGEVAGERCDCSQRLIFTSLAFAGNQYSRRFDARESGT